MVLAENGGARGSWGIWEEETAFRLGGIKLVTLTALPWSMCYVVQILQPLGASLVTQSKAREWWELTSDGYCRIEEERPLVVGDPLAAAGDARDLGSIPGSGRSPGEGNGNLLQYSCLENPTDRGAWRAIAPGIPRSRTRLSNEHPGSRLPEVPNAGTGLGNAQ